MQISEQCLLDALKASSPDSRPNTVDNAFTVRELMTMTGLSQDVTREMLRNLVTTGKVGITRVYRKAVLGGYEARVPGYYYINPS
jgi:hypothetical protein